MMRVIMSLLFLFAMPLGDATAHPHEDCDNGWVEECYDVWVTTPVLVCSLNERTGEVTCWTMYINELITVCECVEVDRGPTIDTGTPIVLPE